MSKIIGISGNLSSPSRTSNLVDEIVKTATQKLHQYGDVVDISKFASQLGSTVTFENFPPVLVEAFQKIHAADLIVIGTPIYKASYTGLLKHFFDLIDPKALSGKVAILAATGGSESHTLVLEYQLRSLASFFGMHTVPTTIYAKDSDFKDYKLENEDVSKRIELAVKQASYLLKQELPTALVA